MHPNHLVTAAATILSSSSTSSVPALEFPSVAHDSAMCLSPQPSTEYMDFMKGLDSLSAPRSLASHLPPSEPWYQVPLYFHVVQPDAKDSRLWMNESKLGEQVDVMNRYFQQARVSFKLEGINRTMSNELHNLNYYPKTLKDCQKGPQKHVDVWKRTHRGGYDALNIYIYSEIKIGPQGGALGWCCPPQPNANDPAMVHFDGCRIAAWTLPGMKKSRQGKVAVHEVGHWLGLLHVFDKDCDSLGDGIDDTPAQSMAGRNDCPKVRDSCPNHPGLDSIHNHMDYTSDACRDSFTPGQIARMRASLNNLRSAREVKEGPPFKKAAGNHMLAKDILARVLIVSGLLVVLMSQLV